MTYPFADLTFTPSVQAAQARNGSREFCEAMSRNDRNFRLGPDEAAFLADRDHFYMATVSETGWPYVQHRGGPPGFIQTLDELRFAFPDFRGNRQYISIGNIASDKRAAFFFIDYARRSRLKALTRIRIAGVDEEPEIIRRFSALGYKAAVERVVIAEIAALDWNCPQHITPRFPAGEIARAVENLTSEIEALRAENAALAAKVRFLEQGA